MGKNGLHLAGFTMRKPLHGMMLAFVLFHILGGCCWHHEDAETGRHDHAYTHKTGNGHQEKPAEESRIPHEGCGHQGACFFVVPQSVGQNVPMGYFPLAVVVCADVTPNLLSGKTLCEVFAWGTGPPLRLHLMHQVLLV